MNTLIIYRSIQVKDVGIVLMTMIRCVIVLRIRRKRNEMRFMRQRKNFNQLIIPLFVEIAITI